MGSHGLAGMIELALAGWLILLAVLVAAAMLDGRIRTAGLLSHRDGGRPDPERLALLAVTAGLALWYVLDTLGTPLDQLRDASGAIWMPDIPDTALLVLGGGQGLYLGGKLTRLAGRLGNAR